jgi:hypothetical protein
MSNFGLLRKILVGQEFRENSFYDGYTIAELLDANDEKGYIKVTLERDADYFEDIFISENELQYLSGAVR